MNTKDGSVCNWGNHAQGEFGLVPNFDLLVRKRIQMKGYKSIADAPDNWCPKTMSQCDFFDNGCRNVPEATDEP